MLGSGPLPRWIQSALELMLQIARSAHDVARERMVPALARWYDLTRIRLQNPRVRAIAIAAGMSLLLAPGLALFRREPDRAVVPVTLAPAAIAPDAASPDPASAATPSDWFAEQPAPGAATAGDPGSYECILEPSDKVSIGSPITGRIEEILVERADLVGQGEVVARLESSVEIAALEVAKARADADGAVQSRLASVELENQRKERAKHLFDGKAVSLDIRQEVETQARVAEAELARAREDRRLASLEREQARAALERRTIRSPIPGVVVERIMSPGEVVDEETILRIARIDPLWVETLLPASEFGQIEPGMTAAVTPEVPGDQVHTARVVMVDRVVDPASGTFSVRLELPNPSHEVPSGLHCQARFLRD